MTSDKNKRPSINKGAIKRLFGYVFKPHKLKWIIVIISIIISALVGVVGSLFIKTLINDYIDPMLEVSLAGYSPDFAPLIRAILFMIVIYAVGIIANFVYQRIMVKIVQSTLRNIRNDMFAKMQHLPIRYFDTHTHGDIMSYYTNDTDTLEQMIGQTLPNVLSSGFTIIFTFVAMLTTSIYLTLVVILFLFIMMRVVKSVGGKSGKYFVAQQQSVAKVNGYIEEMINGQKVIKVFSHEKNAIEGFENINGELRKNAYTANKYANMFMPIMGNIGYFQYVAIAILGSALAILGVHNLSITGVSVFNLGVISSFLLLSKSFTQPVAQLSSQINSVVMAMAGAERIFKFMDEEPETNNGYVTLVNMTEVNGKMVETNEHTHIWRSTLFPYTTLFRSHSDGTVTYTLVKGDVVFENVNFGYVPEKVVLHDVSVYANPGQKVAFVGATGAGKTTITNLLNRFYDIADGKIRYDGININKIKKEDLRRAIGIVLQDTNLFTGTVADNIRYGRLNATDEEVLAAAKLANADDFIQRLPDKYDTMLTSDGANLSQGQRQLLSIARAAVADTPVMILDEATSSIDTRTEKLVQKGTDELMNGRTVFVIAHRLSTIQNSDVILVLDHGEVIEKGNHDSLINKRGKYYQLYTGKFELE